MTLEHVYLASSVCLGVALGINTYRVWKLRKQMETVIHNMNMLGMVLMTEHIKQHEKEHNHV